MKKNKKIIKNATIMLLALVVGFITISPASAKGVEPLIDENTTNVVASLNDNEQAEATPRSGGFVSREYVINRLSNQGSYWYYEYITPTWLKTPEYTISVSVSKGSETQFNSIINAKLSERIEAQFGFTYGTSVDTQYMVGAKLEADKTKYSKLRFRALIQKFYAEVQVVDTYYDTSIGYYTYESDFDGYIEIPIEDEAYIDVYYQ